MSSKALAIGLGQRPSIEMIVQGRDGIDYHLGWCVEGDDLIARIYQWHQRRRVNAYCRKRLRTLTGVEAEEFQHEVNKMKEARRG